MWRVPCNDRPVNYVGSKPDEPSRARERALLSGGDVSSHNGPPPRGTTHALLLVFDEVMTARLSPGGMQQLLGIEPGSNDACEVRRRRPLLRRFGGRTDLMRRFGPLSARRAAARRDLQQRRAHDGGGSHRPDEGPDGSGGQPAERPWRSAARPAKRVLRGAAGSEFCATGYGSLVGLHFTPGPVRDEGDVPESAELRALLHLHMLERGFSYGRRGFIALSLPLGAADVDDFAAAVEQFLLTL